MTNEELPTAERVELSVPTPVQATVVSATPNYSFNSTRKISDDMVFI